MAELSAEMGRAPRLARAAVLHRWWGLVLSLIVGVAWTGAARAELSDDTEALVAAWRRAGLTVRRMDALFLVKDQTRVLALPNGVARTARCVSLVALADRRADFLLSPSLFGAASRWSTGAAPRRSKVGVSQLSWCGPRPAAPLRAGVTMRGAQGAVDLLVVWHDRPLVPVATALPARAEGPLPPPRTPPTGLRLGELGPRLGRVVTDLESGGATAVVQVKSRSGPRGRGALRLKLAAGCHRLAVLSAPPRAGEAVDVDAEIRLPGGGRLLRRDQSHAPDARLGFCLARSRALVLRYAGAARASSTMVVDGRWRIPPGIDRHWGEPARAAMAWALFRRQSPRLDELPVMVFMGMPGTTLVPIVVEPGACYLAAFAVAQGAASAGRLTVRVQAMWRHDDASDEPRAAAVSFCMPPGGSVAELSVELRASAATWLAAVWHLTSGAP